MTPANRQTVDHLIAVASDAMEACGPVDASELISAVFTLTLRTITTLSREMPECRPMIQHALELLMLVSIKETDRVN